MRLTLARESKSAAESLRRNWALPVRGCQLRVGLGPVPDRAQSCGHGLPGVRVQQARDPQRSPLPGRADRADRSQACLPGYRGRPLPMSALRGDLRGGPPFAPLPFS